MRREPVQSLWIGPRLTAMERLTIESFLANGHPFHLYAYDAIEGVPEGATLKDARAVLAEDRLFVYADGFAKGSYAAFSNAFRYKLLLDHGGWWVDTDVVCLRPFDVAGTRMVASEQLDPPAGSIVSTSVIRTDGGDALMQWAWNACQRVDTATVRFGQIGPRLLQQGVDALGLRSELQPWTAFSPVPHFDWRRLLEPGGIALPGNPFAVHLWNQMWTAHAADKDASYAATSFYEQLKRRYSRS